MSRIPEFESWQTQSTTQMQKHQRSKDVLHGRLSDRERAAMTAHEARLRANIEARARERAGGSGST
jgi:hypothetical protein